MDANATKPSKKAWVVKSGAREPLAVVGKRVTVLADEQATGGPELFLGTGPEGTGERPHSHPHDEAIYVLEGQIEYLVPGEEPATVSAGELVYGPGGSVHGFQVKGPQAKYLMINFGGGASAFYAEMHREVGDVPNVPKIVELLIKHGGKPALPPPAK
jgi:quercetin dioxygenase-like cupin family protein